MVNTGVIYSFTNKVNNKVYIGQSINPVCRYKAHIWAAKRGDDNHLYRAMRKYGIEMFEYKVLVDGVNIESLNAYEEAFITVYNSITNGYNKTEGGVGTRGYIVTEETREKFKEINKGGNNPTAVPIVRLDTLETFSCIKDAADYLNVHPMTITIAIRKRHKVKGVYFDVLDNMQIGVSSQIPTNKLFIGNTAKTLICLTTGIIYTSIREAERMTGIARSTISNCIRGKYKTAGGMEWELV